MPSPSDADFFEQDPLLRHLQLKASDWPWPLWQGEGETAVTTWSALRAKAKGQYWPLLVGQAGAFRSFDHHPSPQQRQEIVRQAEQLDLKDWQQGILAGVDLSDLGDEELSAMIAGGAFPPNHEITVQRDVLAQTPFARVDFMLLPVRESWQSLACLGFGGWNACPEPQIHTALLRQWEAEYGAECVACDGAVLELRVAQPPTELTQAEALAQQHYAYCPDIVEQGVQSIQNLAQTLVGSSVWYFWWD